MGLKKYEIITVGRDKRVRALRSWQVGDRYVNIGDVGGIVYDEKTLSQDGACWLFRGNFGFPGARIGGDSIVDVGEAALSTAGAPNVDILGSSVVVGSKLIFESETTVADAIVLTVADFEQGTITYAEGTNWEAWKTPSAQSVRSKAPIFAGGTSVTVKCAVPGYSVQAYVLDRDGIGVTVTNTIQSGVGVTLSVPAGQYFVLRLAKNPTAGIVPADATAAQITFTGLFDTKLVVIDSRLEINPVTSTGTVSICPGGFYPIAPGAKYQDSVIRNSRVVINGHATGNRIVRLISEITGCNAVIDSTSGSSQGAGVYSNVKNLTFTGLPVETAVATARSIIQATDCNYFAVSPTIFPGLTDAQTANMPFIFQGCNVPNGLFYHHAQIANTYKNIDFAKAQADLGKSLAGGRVLASAEVEGMYRLATGAGGLIGSLVESYNSVANLSFSNFATIYGTTIYKDAYFKGIFNFVGTNVFGNKVRSHPLAQVLNVAPRAVQGNFNTATIGQTITGVIPSDIRVCIPTPFRINGANGLKIEGPLATLEALAIFVTPSNVVTAVASSSNGVLPFPAAQLNAYAAYVRFGKTGGAAITPADLAGVTVTTYNGCKIINTKVAVATIAGNVRVEDNATIIDTSVTGTGYFGGNSIAQGLTVEGVVYMKDNAVFAPTISGTPKANILHMTDNASFTGVWAGAGTRLIMSGNTRFDSATNHNTLGFVEMRDNARVSGSGSVSVSGALVLEDDASITGGNVSISGDITLCGKYKQTASKVWTGKRTITDVNEPEYDNNVKTQYDF